MHAIVTGQITGCLARGDDVVGGDPIFAVRQRDVVDVAPSRAEDRDCFLHRLRDFRVQSLAEMVAHDSQFGPRQRASNCSP